MQCSCGGMTTDHKVVRKKNLVGEFMQCKECGRVSWLWKTKELKDEINKTNTP